MSLNVNKAFDNLSWPYLMTVLRRYGFGAYFLGWIKTLYDSPQAKIKYYGFESSLFSIRRGTRQGFLLSPLLFILALEPLAEAVPSHPDISGIGVANSISKLSLFADDILMTMTFPKISLPNLLSLLVTFASLSGLRVNPTKSKVMQIKLTPWT